MQIEQLTLKDGEEAFNNGIIQTVTLTTHTLPDSFFNQYALIRFLLILPTLIGMKNQVCPIGKIPQRLLQHIHYQRKSWVVTYRVANDIPTAEIDDR